MPPKKVFVSGCFDMLHSGHVRFLEEAATYGEVHIGLGSDRTVIELKGRAPVNTQAERQYMLEALRHVKSCRV
ncbi:MAG: adenylyltransferase/cytidyltransferase family protein, partial [Verrucomicrobiota bacterium]